MDSALSWLTFIAAVFSAYYARELYKRSRQSNLYYKLVKIDKHEYISIRNCGNGEAHNLAMEYDRDNSLFKCLKSGKICDRLPPGQSVEVFVNLNSFTPEKDRCFKLTWDDECKRGQRLDVNF